MCCGCGDDDDAWSLSCKILPRIEKMENPKKIGIPNPKLEKSKKILSVNKHPTWRAAAQEARNEGAKDHKCEVGIL